MKKLFIIMMCCSLVIQSYTQVVLTIEDGAFLNQNDPVVGINVDGDIVNHGSLGCQGILKVSGDFSSFGESNLQGKLEFDGSGNSQMLCTDTINELTIHKEGELDELVLVDSAYVKEELSFRKGLLNLNNKTIHVHDSEHPYNVLSNNFYKYYALNGTVHLNLRDGGDEDIVFFLGTESGFATLALSFVNLQLGSSSYIRAEAIPDVHPLMPVSDNYSSLHWQIEYSGLTDYDELSSFTWYPANLMTGDYTQTHLHLYHQGEWKDESLLYGTTPGEQSVSLINDPAGYTSSFESNFLGDIAIFSVDDLCLGDLDGNGAINSADLGALLNSFGCSSNCGAADIDGNGVVNSADLGALLSSFGSPCE